MNATPGPFNREPRCQCCRFLPAPSGRSAPFEATGRPRQRGGGSSCPGGPCPSFGFVGLDDDGGAAKKADGCGWIVSEVARGWHRGFPPGCSDTSPPPPACAITVLAGGLATPIQPQRMYKRIQARAAGRAHAGSAYKKDERTLFPSSFFFFFSRKHLVETVYSPCFHCLKKKEEEERRIQKRKVGQKQIHEQGGKYRPGS